ncbi:MAG: hypothetical protein JO064_11850, partial [Actinobacteria bacterium]|nr:hypothetical protein [Actinomycetota bacterium]
PVVVEAMTDPEVPPLPPHITLEQAKAFTSSILADDPNRTGFIEQAVEQMFPGLLSKE